MCPHRIPPLLEWSCSSEVQSSPICWWLGSDPLCLPLGAGIVRLLPDWAAGSFGIKNKRHLGICSILHIMTKCQQNCFLTSDMVELLKVQKHSCSALDIVCLCVCTPLLSQPVAFLMSNICPSSCCQTTQPLLKRNVDSSPPFLLFPSYIIIPV